MIQELNVPGPRSKVWCWHIALNTMLTDGLMTIPSFQSADGLNALAPSVHPLSLLSSTCQIIYRHSDIFVSLIFKSKQISLEASSLSSCCSSLHGQTSQKQKGCLKQAVSISSPAPCSQFHCNLEFQPPPPFNWSCFCYHQPLCCPV